MLSVHIERMRTLNKNYLATHPLGDEKATITLHVPVPENRGLPLNADGTRPQITLVGEGDTYGILLRVLSEVRDSEGEMLLEAYMDLILSRSEFEDVESLDDAAPRLKEIFTEVHEDFPTTTVTFEMTVEQESGAVETHPVTIAIKSPSMELGVSAAVAMTKPRILTQVAIELCPRADVDWDDSEDPDSHVMVVND